MKTKKCGHLVLVSYHNFSCGTAVVDWDQLLRPLLFVDRAGWAQGDFFVEWLEEQCACMPERA